MYEQKVKVLWLDFDGAPLQDKAIKLTPIYLSLTLYFHVITAITNIAGLQISCSSFYK